MSDLTKPYLVDQVPGMRRFGSTSSARSSSRAPGVAGMCALLLAACAQSADQPVQSVPIDSWGRSVAAAVRPLIVYADGLPKPAQSSDFLIWMAVDGTITDTSMYGTSLTPQWDLAASQALRDLGKVPRNEKGEVPYQAVVQIAPSGVHAYAVKSAGYSISGRARPSYGVKIADTVRRHVVFPDVDQVDSNPEAEFDVRLGNNGTILSVVLFKSSGLPQWDAAARAGLVKAERFPLDVNGKVPPRIIVTMRPKR